MEESTLFFLIGDDGESSSLMRGGVRSKEVSPKNKLERGSKESKREVRLEEDDRRAMEEEEKENRREMGEEGRSRSIKKRPREREAGPQILCTLAAQNFPLPPKFSKPPLYSTPPFFNPSSATATQLIGFISA